MRLRATFHRAAEVGDDFDAQLSRGGYLVRVEPPEGLAQFSALPLELVAPDGEELVLDAQVVQAFPGVGVAVTFAVTPELAEWAAAARTGTSADRDAKHEWASEQREVVGSASRIPTALRGNRDERMAIMRENVPALHGHVLRNPGLQLDEVAAIAKMRTVSSELLKQIADRREWAQRPEIALALVRNPKTPVGVAIKLLDHVAPGELRQLAKDTHTRTPIQHAARRKVVS